MPFELLLHHSDSIGPVWLYVFSLLPSDPVHISSTWYKNYVETSYLVQLLVFYMYFMNQLPDWSCPVQPRACHWNCVFWHNFSGMKRSCWTTVSWRSCLSLEVVSSIPARSTIIYRFLCGFICVSLCQSNKIKPTNMYVASARAQFKINTHRCWNWHPCIPDGLSVVHCSLEHVIGIVFFDTISVAWSDRAGQLSAGGVASVWRSWVRSPPGPR